MRLLVFIAILPCLLLDYRLAAAQIAVHFQAKAIVAGPRIVLADIARITPEGGKADAIGQLPVAAAPAPGKTKELSTPSIITSLRNRPEVTEVDWQGSPTIQVERAGNMISRNQFQQIVNDYLQENKNKLPNDQTRFTVTRAPDELALPSGELTWNVTPSKPGIIGSTSFTVALFVDGKPAGTTLVRGRLETIVQMAVAAAALHKGEVITSSHIVMQAQDMSNADKPFTAMEQVIGMQVARTVNAGTILTQEHLIQPASIKEGEMVKIMARKSGLQLTASGIARNNGRLGEMIQVKNISSNKLVHCRVDGPGSVSVEF